YLPVAFFLANERSNDDAKGRRQIAARKFERVEILANQEDRICVDHVSRCSESQANQLFSVVYIFTTSAIEYAGFYFGSR
ncbi:MAG TPA: hypothetical protein VNT76_01035, partial [Candidatus Binatus sp.]|nr:hypothetical protein [Candidatus Binatus sp.]